jgi:hypothetical protein
MIERDCFDGSLGCALFGMVSRGKEAGNTAEIFNEPDFTRYGTMPPLNFSFYYSLKNETIGPTYKFPNG